MPSLWIDTNVARSVTDLRTLCRLAQRKGVRVVVHPQVYLERRRQMRADCARDGREFSEVSFDGFLRQQHIEVRPLVLDQETAGAWADALHLRYPSNETWEAAKKATLGGDLRAGFRVEPGDMPMTTDWLIALVVERDAAARIITRDEGEEWRVLREATPPRALRWEEAIAWLEALADASG